MSVGVVILVTTLFLSPFACAAAGVSEGNAVGSDKSGGSLAHQKLEVHLFGGDMRPGAPLARWYRDIGITDVWLYPVHGAFPQDQAPETQRSLPQLAEDGILGAYGANAIRYWWFERPVPDYFYYMDSQGADPGKDVIWGTTERAEARWAEVCGNIQRIYGSVRDAGFAGIVYDNEAYYSYAGPAKRWLWEGHEGQLGPTGNYYRRGKQVGSAIMSVWPNPRVMMVYSFGYPGEYWWYKGFKDSGVDLYLAVEHTYGAGPAKSGDQWYQHWWRPGKLTGIVEWKRSVFRFLKDNRHVVPGLFPIDFGTGLPNYEFRYFKEQLQQASALAGDGPFSVWLWPQGDFSPERWNDIRFPPGISANDYVNLLKSYSLQNE